MPWARLGDNSATYPKLMMIAGFPGADERAVNEVRGWLLACATQSAGHMTDYVIDFGTAALFGAGRTKKLIAWCVKAGLLTPTRVAGSAAWIIINDPEFIHIRTRAEVEWDRQRRSDLRNPGLTVPVRLRDGDNCRYCGVQVQWRGQKTNRSAELDHREPGEPGTVETLVVACRSCNGSRQDNPQWDDDHPLRPPPAAPSYGATTARFLTENGYPTRPNLAPDVKITAASDLPSADCVAAASDTAPVSATPGAGRSNGCWDEPGAEATDTAPMSATRAEGTSPIFSGPAVDAWRDRPGLATRVDTRVGGDSIPCSDERTLVGSGREGPGSGVGRNGAGRGGGPPPLKRRGRKGGRKRGREGDGA